MALSTLILAPFIILTNLLALPYFAFLLLIAGSSIFRAWLGGRQSAGPLEARFLIIVPAHDEETGIAETVRSCLSLDYPKDLFDLNVIADNCTDSTATIAREAGATVVERFDSTKKSKGYAIEYLLDSLEKAGRFDSYSGYVVIDADTVADPGLLRAFDRELARGYDWLQAYYTVSNRDDSWRTRLMTYAFSLLNGVALHGQNAIGQSAGFRGNGMCFSSKGLRRFPFQTHGLVEDIEFSWDLRIAGEWVKFVPDTSVAGKMVSSAGPAAVSQRKRWEYGRNELRKSKRGPLWRSSRLGMPAKIGSILELTMPTMVQLAMIYVALTALNLISVWTFAPPGSGFVFQAILVLQALTTLGLSLYAISPFLAMRLPWRYAVTLVAFPFYASWKILASKGGKPQEWVRTARDS